MPIPAVLEDAFRSRQFWLDYLLDRFDEPEWPALGHRCRAEFPVGGGYALVIDFTRFLHRTDLSLRCPAREHPRWLARDDLAYWPREVLRWSETELLSKAAARLDTDLQHPGLLLVLLYRFTPLTADDDRRVVWSLMRQAFNSLGVLSLRAIERCLREGASDLRDGFAWRDCKRGWVLQDLSSGRDEPPRAPKSKFPFREYAALLNAAQRTCDENGGRRRTRRST
jgi:hypothetical protein